MNCLQCGNVLSGRQRKYCHIKCKKTYENKNNYIKHKHLYYQKKRGIQKKQKLIELSGGKCTKCGYNKCIAALSYHHRDPSIKKFTLDMGNLCFRSWNSVLEEYKKCDLLCMNCHTELHYLEDNAEFFKTHPKVSSFP